MIQIETVSVSDGQVHEEKGPVILEGLQPQTLAADNAYTKAMRIRNWALAIQEHLGNDDGLPVTIYAHSSDNSTPPFGGATDKSDSRTSWAEVTELESALTEVPADAET